MAIPDWKLWDFSEDLVSLYAKPFKYPDKGVEGYYLHPEGVVVEGIQDQLYLMSCKIWEFGVHGEPKYWIRYMKDCPRDVDGIHICGGKYGWEG